MSVLVTGATGTIGSLVVQRLAAEGTQVRALVRQPGKRRFPPATAAAGTWREAIGRDASDGGTGRAAFEQQMASFAPAWMAYDLRLMMAGIQTIGMQAEPGAVDRQERLLGRPRRTYAPFVNESDQAGQGPTVRASGGRRTR